MIPFPGCERRHFGFWLCGLVPWGVVSASAVPYLAGFGGLDAVDAFACQLVVGEGAFDGYGDGAVVVGLSPVSWPPVGLCVAVFVDEGSGFADGGAYLLIAVPLADGVEQLVGVLYVVVAVDGEDDEEDD